MRKPYPMRFKELVWFNKKPVSKDRPNTYYLNSDISDYSTVTVENNTVTLEYRYLYKAEKFYYVNEEDGVEWFLNKLAACNPPVAPKYSLEKAFNSKNTPFCITPMEIKDSFSEMTHRATLNVDNPILRFEMEIFDEWLSNFHFTHGKSTPTVITNLYELAPNYASCICDYLDKTKDHQLDYMVDFLESALN